MNIIRIEGSRISVLSMESLSERRPILAATLFRKGESVDDELCHSSLGVNTRLYFEPKIAPNVL